MTIDNLVIRAQRFCERGKYRFTEPRERVLELLANSTEPLGAYQILEALSSSEKKLKPPTVYRAIDFWSEHGFIHRVESKNAYIACCEHKHHHNFCIIICNDCNSVRELKLDKFNQLLSSQLPEADFKVQSSTTEVYGLCANCS